MIILHFDLPPQFKYELFHIRLTLIDCVKDYKSRTDFNSINFKSGKVRLYEEVK